MTDSVLYSLSLDFPNGLYTEQLQELLNYNLNNIVQSIQTNGDDVVIYFTVELSQGQIDIVESIVDDYVPVEPYDDPTEIYTKIDLTLTQGQPNYFTGFTKINGNTTSFDVSSENVQVSVNGRYVIKVYVDNEDRLTNTKMGIMYNISGQDLHGDTRVIDLWDNVHCMFENHLVLKTTDVLTMSLYTDVEVMNVSVRLCISTLC